MNIARIFDSIAKRYDITNHITSFGTHLLWKKVLVKESLYFLSSSHSKMLDIACGTGDIIAIAKKLEPSLQIFGIDPSLEMLKIAECRLNFVRKPFLIKGFAENLPFEEGTFNLITVSFGVRNFSDRRKAFKEIFRVLEPKGVFSILEFSKPDNGNLIQNLSWFYTRKLVPILGGVLTHQQEAYKYLVHSIEDFPLPAQLTREVEEVGFSPLRVKRLFPPIAVLYIFRKL